MVIKLKTVVNEFLHDFFDFKVLCGVLFVIVCLQFEKMQDFIKTNICMFFTDIYILNKKDDETK